ncbi:MAG: chlorophyll a/b-binding protein [Pseudanabaena sp.]|jgi:hypothetical protein
MSEETKARTAFTKDERGILNNWAIEPKMYVDEKSEGRFGFTEYAEMVNGRLAMVGFTLLIIIEMVSGKAFSQIIGF